MNIIEKMKTHLPNEVCGEILVPKIPLLGIILDYEYDSYATSIQYDDANCWFNNVTICALE